jgi:hypothetical protein
MSKPVIVGFKSTERSVDVFYGCRRRAGRYVRSGQLRGGKVLALEWYVWLILPELIIGAVG